MLASGFNDNDESLYKFALEESQNITDISQVQQLLQVLNQKEQKIDSELDELLSQRSNLVEKLTPLTKLGPTLEVVGDKTKGLVNQVASTCELAKQVSSKVRVLDIAQENVQQTIQRVQDVIDLKWSVEGLDMAMKNDDFEQAAIYAHKYLSFKKDLLDSDLLDTSVSAETIQEHLDKLTKKIKREFDEAVKHEKKHDIEKYMKMFPMIGIKEFGLRKYTQYACSRVGSNASACLRNILKDPNYDPANVDFIFLLKRLFEDAAACVEAESIVIDTHYGPGNTLILLQGLSREVDKQSENILDTFSKERKIEKYISKVKRTPHMSMMGGRSPSTQNVRQQGADDVDILSLDPLLVEIVMISSASEMFDRFIRKKAKVEIDIITEKKEGAADDWLLSGKECKDGYLSALNKNIQILMGKYVLLDESYMKHSIVKAIQMNENESECLTSMMVDDAFYILQRCGHRSLSSLKVDNVCAVVNHINSLLLEEFGDNLRKNLSTSVQDQFVQLLSGGDINTVFGNVQTKLQQDSTEAKLEYMIHLNNVDVSANYIIKLHDDVLSRFREIFTNEVDEKSMIKGTSCLSELLQTSKSYSSLLQDSMTKLCTNSLYPIIESMFDRMEDFSFVISDEQLGYNQANDPFIQAFCNELTPLLNPFKNGLTEGNYELFCRLVVQHVAVAYEKFIYLSKFNYNGGIQFDKDVRFLISYLSTLTNANTRNKCARLTQIANILTVEKPSDASYFSDSRFTSSDVKHFLALRVDLNPSEISNLKL